MGRLLLLLLTPRYQLIQDLAEPMRVVKLLIAAIGMLCCSGTIAQGSTLSASELNNSAYSLLQNGQYKQAFAESQRSLVLARKERNPTEEARALSNLGSNLLYLGDYDRALALYFESLEIASKTNNVEGELRATNNIASIYSALKNPVEELAYRTRHLRISEKSSDQYEVLISHIGLISAYANNDRLEQARESVLLSKVLLKSNGNQFIKSYALFAENEIYEAEGKFGLALKNAQLTLKISREEKFDGIEVAASAEIAHYYNLLGEFDLAIETAFQTLKLAKKLNIKTEEANTHKLLSEAFNNKQQFKEALYHIKLSHDLNEKTINQKVKTLGEITKIERDIASTEEKLIRSQKDREILALKLEKQKQNQLIWMISLLFISLSILFLYFRKTSRNELARQKRLNHQLKELDIVKDRVLTNTSHELRTPLNGIIGLSNIIIHDEQNKLSDSAIQAVKLIKSSGEQLSVVINDILDLSKLKSNKITVTNSSFDLVDLTNDVIEVCKPSTLEKGVEIIFTQSNQSIEINQDRIRLQQILFNIIGNAIKFTRQGEIKIIILKRSGDFSLCVSDSGIGIPTDKVERVLEGFEQVDNGASREFSGSGLGLAISQKLAETLGGELVLTSELGKGTQVKICLPC